METTKWIELATSKDKRRPNLQGVYRDSTCLVATDGHRLHLSNGLPEATPGYLDGRDEVFPEWRQVMPEDGKRVVYHFRIPGSGLVGSVGKEARDQLRQLKRLLALVKGFTTIPLVKLECSDDGVTVIYDDRAGKMFKFPLFCDHEYVGPNDKEITLGVNLAYFIDAISLDTPTEVKIHGELSPILLESESCKAIVMPSRL